MTKCPETFIIKLNTYTHRTQHLHQGNNIKQFKVLHTNTYVPTGSIILKLKLSRINSCKITSLKMVLSKKKKDYLNIEVINNKAKKGKKTKQDHMAQNHQFKQFPQNW